MKTQTNAEFKEIREAGKISVFGIICPYGTTEASFINSYGCRIAVTDAVTEPTMILKNTSHGTKKRNIVGILVPNLDVVDLDFCTKATGVGAAYFNVNDLIKNQTLKTVE